MDISNKVGEWLLGAFEYIFQEKVLLLYGEIMKFLSAFIVHEGSLDIFPFVYQLTGYMAAVVNALLILVILWYAMRKMFSYAGFDVDNPLMFFSKLIFYGVLANFAFFLTRYIVWFFSCITSVVMGIYPGLNFYNLKDVLMSLVPREHVQFFSVEGIFLFITMFFVIKLCFTFCARFLLIILVITPLSPFAVIANVSQSMSGIFKGWLKLLLTLMTSQLAQLILVIGIVGIVNSPGLDMPPAQESFFILCTLWLMTKVDTYVKEVVAGIGVYNNLSSGLAGIQNSINSLQQARSFIVKK